LYCVLIWRNTYRILLENSERKRSLGRPRCRGEDNIKIDLCGRVEHMEWVHLNHDGDPLEGYCEHANNLMVP
jgi:hypothetical protein